MRGVVFTGGRELELMQFDDPAPGPQDVVIEMKASGMCGSDLHQYRRPKGGAQATGLPMNPDPVIADTGLPQQWEIFERVAERLGRAPPVVLSSDVLRDPRAMLTRAFFIIGRSFMPTRASGPRPTCRASMRRNTAWMSPRTWT